MFCSQCGNQLADDVRFCKHCGHPTGIGSTTTAPSAPPVYTAPPPPIQPVSTVSTPKKTSGAVSVLWYILFIAIFACSGYFLIKAGIPLLWALGGVVLFLVLGLILFFVVRGGAKALPKLVICIVPVLLVAITLGLNAVGLLGWTSGGAIGVDSSAVSMGVSLDDLGNILNGQYYYDDGTSVFYSTFDKSNAAHIYRKNKKNGTTASIFDGFGWSLVVDKGWLYFSGNAGTTIDGTYHLFRIKTDGTQLETLDSGYCFGMSFYKNRLYYIVKEADSTYSFARLGLDGSSRETLVKNTWGSGIVFENHMYYLDDTGGLNVAKPDGTDPLPLLTTKISRFIIGNGDLYYADSAGTLWTSKIDGSNPKKLRDPGTKPILSINSYKDTVYFSDYDTTALEGRYAYQYYIHSIKADGTGEKDLYSGVSQNCWMNLVGGKLYVLDYAYDLSTGKMPAIVRDMPLGGGAATDLPSP